MAPSTSVELWIHSLAKEVRAIILHPITAGTDNSIRASQHPQRFPPRRIPNRNRRRQCLLQIKRYPTPSTSITLSNSHRFRRRSPCRHREREARCPRLRSGQSLGSISYGQYFGSCQRGRAIGQYLSRKRYGANTRRHSPTSSWQDGGSARAFEETPG